jgi:hypothetical protein
MIAPMQMPGLSLSIGPDTTKIKIDIDRDLQDAVSYAESCANRLRKDGIYDGRGLVEFFVRKAPFLSNDQKRNRVSREVSAYTEGFANS